MTQTLDRMPVLFLGHGSPMSAIEESAFTRRLSDLGKELGRPNAILVISAHWLTAGTWVTAMERPRTIHDFGGFPRELYEIEYAAPGDPRLAARMGFHLNEDWGLDHGSWTVLRHLFPAADVPTLQLSIDMSEPAEKHLELGAKLRKWRDEGVLIVGSGNVTHNLRKLSHGAPVPWALEFDRWVKEKIEARDFARLAKEYATTLAGQLAVPTSDHYLPLLYALGASDEDDPLQWEYEGIELGSISMRSFSFGRRQP